MINNMDQSLPHHLSEKLLRIPVTLEGMVQLWLTYKGLKPVSTVQFKTGENSKDHNCFTEWLEDAGLTYSPDLKSSEFVFVSKEIELAKRAAKLMWSENEEDLLEKGRIFGYPMAAVKGYASKEKMSVITPKTFPMYWAAYVRYLVREENTDEDCETGKVWADVVRSDIPELASLFEEEMARAEVK